MPCHHAMAEASPETKAESSEPSVTNNGANNKGRCQNHCCCGVTTSEWAKLTSDLLPVLHLLIEPARLLYADELPTADISGDDSARAPPRS